MRKIILASISSMVIVLVALLATSSPSMAMTPTQRINKSVLTVKEMSAKEDAGTIGDLIKRSYGVVIVPMYYKAAIGVGISSGEGLVLRHDPDTGRWYGPSFMNITGASYGLQIGAESTALLLVITNQKGMEHFYGDTVKLGANVDIAAGPVGRSAGAATDVNLKASIYSYSISKGLFAGLSLGGSVMSTDVKANSSYWGSKYNSKTILQKRASNSKVQSLLRQLNVLAKQ